MPHPSSPPSAPSIVQDSSPSRASRHPPRPRPRPRPRMAPHPLPRPDLRRDPHPNTHHPDPAPPSHPTTSAPTPPDSARARPGGVDAEREICARSLIRLSSPRFIALAARSYEYYEDIPAALRHQARKGIYGHRGWAPPPRRLRKSTRADTSPDTRTGTARNAGTPPSSPDSSSGSDVDVDVDMRVQGRTRGSSSPSRATNSDASDANDQLDPEPASAHSLEEDTDSVARMAGSLSLLSPALFPSISSPSCSSSQKDEITPRPNTGQAPTRDAAGTDAYAAADGGGAPPKSRPPA
ncbi:hypothetical protein B0H13DRAFT_2351558 [Mycena leptocephala]|nr:hypothetical protein B0H13DRAFT_2351558 [Mycena leptocephala]